MESVLLVGRNGLSAYLELNPILDILLGVGIPDRYFSMVPILLFRRCLFQFLCIRPDQQMCKLQTPMYSMPTVHGYNIFLPMDRGLFPDGA